MARAIRQIKKEAPRQDEEQAKAVAEIVKELAENREAIMKTIGILKGLHDMKVLDAAHALLEQRTEVGAIALQQFNQPGMHNIIKNGMGAVGFLGALQPDQLNTILDGVGHGLKRLSKTGEKGEKQTIWRMRKRLRSPEIRAAMTTMVDFMEGMGEVFLQNGENKKG
ncbi:DUF1641 domain-containing protein [Peribacillus cavernae]|uniref:DUF1641 domain-containing protein n=1 Tax=Peribacillus cavernae TaxID=1674310 RepID=A0A433HS14_9BACI|nr:DUF1641 domain-containing protein [Peribacillus cavernae]MDQ0220626.1 uncharacterized protein YjgD (DUF1641 family) [Peribacillus cavernae]RUQ31088.1 DUF1641 domain-containing protein [Peribacillus cavernae]